jgi:electron transfer flavoprotein beta subunit
MNIVVCVKQVPDTWSERTLKESDSTLDRDAADAVINELDEFAIEEGLRLAEAHGGEVTIRRASLGSYLITTPTHHTFRAQRTK